MGAVAVLRPRAGLDARFEYIDEAQQNTCRHTCSFPAVQLQKVRLEILHNSKREWNGGWVTGVDIR